jgi:hypothetical protein
MAEGGEELFDLGRFAGRTVDLLIAKYQDLKVLIAFHATIFIDGHIRIPSVCLFPFLI